MDSQVVYSCIFRYVDMLPVNKEYKSVFENQYYWITKLNDTGFNISQEQANAIPETNFKTVYVLLALYSFDIERAFISACERGLEQESTFLSAYVPNTLLEECASVTQNCALIQKLPLEVTPNILLQFKDNRDKMRSVLFNTPVVSASSDIITELLNSKSSDIIANKLNESQVLLYASIANKEAARIFDSKHQYAYSIDKAIDYDLEHSILRWVKDNQTQLQLKNKLLRCITSNCKSGKLIVPYIESGLQSFVQHAIDKDNFDILSLLPYTSRDLSKAILLGKTNSVKAMLKVATKDHLAQAIKQNRIAEYNILRIGTNTK